MRYGTHFSGLSIILSSYMLKMCPNSNSYEKIFAVEKLMKDSVFSCCTNKSLGFSLYWLRRISSCKCVYLNNTLFLESYVA